MRGIIKYGVAATMLAGAAAASATSLPQFSSAGVIQSGNSDSAQCQTSTPVVEYAPNSTGVWLGSVTVSNINGACDGKFLTVSTVRPNGTIISTDSTKVNGSSATVSHFPGTYINDTNYDSNTNSHANQVDHVIATFSDLPPA